MQIDIVSISFESKREADIFPLVSHVMEKFPNLLIFRDQSPFGEEEDLEGYGQAYSGSVSGYLLTPPIAVVAFKNGAGLFTLRNVNVEKMLPVLRKFLKNTKYSIELSSVKALARFQSGRKTNLEPFEQGITRDLYPAYILDPLTYVNVEAEGCYWQDGETGWNYKVLVEFHDSPDQRNPILEGGIGKFFEILIEGEVKAILKEILSFEN